MVARTLYNGNEYMNEPKYVKDLFEEDFIDKWIDLIFDFDIKDYSKSISEGIKTAICLAEKEKRFNEFNKISYDKINSINNLLEVKKLTITQYKFFLSNFPILMGIAIEQFYLQQLIKEKLDNFLLENNYISIKVNPKEFIKHFISDFFINFLSAEKAEDFTYLANDVPQFFNYVSERDKTPFIQLGLLYSFIQLLIITINQITNNLLTNVDSILHSYFYYDTFYKTSMDFPEIQKDLHEQRTDMIYKDIILDNISKQHGGKEALSDEEKVILFELKNEYNMALTLLRQVRFILKNTKTKNVCKKKVLYDAGALLFDDNVYKNFLNDLDNLFKCPCESDSVKCKFSKGKLCTYSDKSIKINILKYIKSKNGNLFYYLRKEHSILDDKHLILLLNKKTNSEIALMFARKEDIKGLPQDIEGLNYSKRKIVTRSNKTLLKDFSSLCISDVTAILRCKKIEIRLFQELFSTLYENYLLYPDKKTKEHIKIFLEMLSIKISV